VNIKKCNGCKKILEKEPHYTIGDIEYTIPGGSFKRLILSKDKTSQTKRVTKESWVDYADLDFCERCWKKLAFSKWVKKLK
jgi:hypothetical protein